MSGDDEPRFAPGRLTAEAADLVSPWARTPADVAAWCSRTEAPVPGEVIQSWVDQPDVLAYLLIRDNEPVGYGELWINNDAEEVELAHLIMSPAHRRQGLGKLLTRALATRARQIHPAVFLRVAPENTAALSCYRSVGFVRVLPSTEDDWNRNQPQPTSG